MKILRIIARLNVGGPARHVVWLTEALSSDDFESVLVAGTVPPGEEDMSYLAAEAGIEPVLVKEMSRELSPKDIVSFWKLYRLMLHYRPDIVHTHTAKAGTVGRAAAFAYRWLTWRSLIGKPRQVTVIHTFHGHVFHSYYGRAKTSIFIAIEKLLARFATNRIITISPQQLREINQEVGIGRSEQFHVIPLGIDLEPFAGDGGERQHFRDEVGVREDTLLVGFLGRLTEIKNIPCFLKAAALAGPGSNMFFAIVGDGHLRKSLEKTAVQLGVGKTVRFLGNRNDIPSVYDGLDIVVLTSHNEGTPLSLIEAMAAGKPVVSTAVGGVIDLLGEVIEKHKLFSICERGIAVPPDSAEGINAGIQALAADAALKQQLANAGKFFVQAHYSRERLVKDIKNLYLSLSAG